MEITNEITVVVTGHRKLANEAWSRKAVSTYLQSLRPTLMINGLALGFDQICLEEAMKLGIPVEGHIPFPSFPSRWPQHLRDRYEGYLPKLCRTVLVSKQNPTSRWNAGAKLQLRNVSMQRSAVIKPNPLILAGWEGAHKGGTFNFLRLKPALPTFQVDSRRQRTIWHENGIEF